MNLLQIEAGSSPAPPGASIVRPLIERLATLAIEEAAGRLSEMLPLPMQISYFDSVLSDSVRKIMPETVDATWCAAILLECPEILEMDCVGGRLIGDFLEATEMVVGDLIESRVELHAERMGFELLY